MADIDAYLSGSTYEIFMCRALKLQDRNFSKGADGSFMQNLINMENGANLKSLVGSQEKQFEKVKAYIGKGLDSFLKFKLNPTEKDVILSLKARLEGVHDASGLMSIVESGLEVTSRFR